MLLQYSIVRSPICKDGIIMKRLVIIAFATVSLMYGCQDKEDVKTIQITEVSIERIALELSVGDTVTLHAAITPVEAGQDVSVEWSSSNTDVAVVDENGTVTALAAGNAVITVAVQQFSSTCPVVVEESAFEFVPEMAESGYAVNAFSNTKEEPVLDEAVIWLRSADYTLERDPSYSGNIKQTGKELQLSLNLAAGSDKVIPEGRYTIYPISYFTPDEYVPMTSFAYYTIDFYELGTVYADYDAGEMFVPVCGEITLTKSGNIFVVDVEMYNESSERFVCHYEGELLFDLDTFDKYLML